MFPEAIMLAGLLDMLMLVTIVVIATIHYTLRNALQVVMSQAVMLAIPVGLLDMLLKLLQVILIRWMVIFIYAPVMLPVQ